mgnify:FL=1
MSEKEQLEPVALEPCPFCGGLPELVPARPAGTPSKPRFQMWHWPSVRCENGHAFRFYGSVSKLNTPVKIDLATAEVISEWNTRPPRKGRAPLAVDQPRNRHIRMGRR